MENLPVVFINCRDHPFVEDILSNRKIYETRTRNTLGRFANKRVFIAETGKGKPVVRCSAVILGPHTIKSKEIWERHYRERACILPGSQFDWHDDTKCKYAYYLMAVHDEEPFVPTGKRHGRVWMEVE